MINVFDTEYNLLENYRDSFDFEEFNSKMTEDFLDFDYIIGDYAYSKLRLKGFYDEKNKKVKPYNNFKEKDYYIKNNCAYDCKYFILKKLWG